MDRKKRNWFQNTMLKNAKQISLSRRTFGVLPVAMAWGQYFYEKQMALKDLAVDIDLYKSEEEIEIKETKIIVININDGYVKLNLKKMDVAKSLKTRTEDVSGTECRRYWNSVIKIRPRNGEKCSASYRVLSSPTCLLILEQLKRHAGLKLRLQEKNEIYKLCAALLQVLLQQDKECKRKKVEVLCVATKSLSDVLEDKELKVELQLPVLSNINYTGIGCALAYLYFFNYLLRILPNLPLRMDKFKKKKNLQSSFIRQMLTVVNKSGYVGQSMTEEYDIENYFNLEDHCVKVGLDKRCFTSTVYKIKDPKKERQRHFFCVVDYATPIRQLYNMSNSYLVHKSNFNDVFADEVQNFSDKLKDLLIKFKYDDIICIIDYDDESNSHLPLSRILYDHCEDFCQKEATSGEKKK